MDISNANMEPFYRFLRFTEHFNRSIKITYGALQDLGRHSRSSRSLTGLIELPTGGEPWGDGHRTKWREIAEFATHAGGFLSHMGLVYVMSAFEDLLIGIKAECDRYSYDVLGYNSRPAARADHDQDGAFTVWMLLDQLRWSREPIEFLAPVLKYFLTVRHCIAHRGGRASRYLVDQSESEELSQALANWPNTRGKHPPQFPVIQAGASIPMLPRHSIFACEVCYRAADYVNSQARHMLGKRGILNMAAHHTFLSENRVSVAAWRSPIAMINRALTERYLVYETDDSETISILRGLNRWQECLTVFKRLYPQFARTAGLI